MFYVQTFCCVYDVPLLGVANKFAELIHEQSFRKYLNWWCTHNSGICWEPKSALLRVSGLWNKIGRMHQKLSFKPLNPQSMKYLFVWQGSQVPHSCMHHPTKMLGQNILKCSFSSTEHCSWCLIWLVYVSTAKLTIFKAPHCLFLGIYNRCIFPAKLEGWKTEIQRTYDSPPA